MLPLGALSGLLGVVAADILSRSLLLDLIAWWPAWLALILLTLAVRGRRLGRIRVSGLVPLVVLAVLAALVAGHVQGWALMPSATPRLVGPVPETEGAALEARLDGLLVVEAGGHHLYRVDPVRLGGRVGIPGAREQVGDEVTVVRLEAADDPGLYRFAGWEIRLSPETVWGLVLVGEVDADLSGLQVSDLVVGGEGRVVLGPAPDEAFVSVSGVFEVVVPAGQPTLVIGDAQVPGSWQGLDDGFRSPAEGEGWVITVEDAAVVRVIEGGQGSR